MMMVTVLPRHSLIRAAPVDASVKVDEIEVLLGERVGALKDALKGSNSIEMDGDEGPGVGSKVRVMGVVVVVVLGVVEL
jgi:hypothetical protein